MTADDIHEADAGGPDSERVGGQYGDDLFDEAVDPGTEAAVDGGDAELEAAAIELVQDYPELGQEEHARALVERSVEAAQELGRPDLAHDPEFWRMVHIAGGGGSAAPAQSADVPPDLGDLIVNAGGAGQRALPF